MTNTGIKKPSQVARARERLDKAVARVEAVLKTRGQSDDGGLARELEAMREKNAALKESHRTVSERLDITIDRLKTMLES